MTQKERASFIKFDNGRISFLNGPYFSPIYLIIAFLVISLSSLFFESKGPIILTLVGSLSLIIILSNIRIDKHSSYEQIISSRESRWKCFIIFHSHHDIEECKSGKELKIRNKYFCAGCYGILTGTFISLFLGLNYLMNDSYQNIMFVLIFITPLCFVPIILRYTIFINMNSINKFFANLLIPIGCYLMLFISDNAYKSPIINGGIMFIILIVGYLRIVASRHIY